MATVILTAAAISCKERSADNPTQWVNPFIGTVNYIEDKGERMGMGKTHPGATLPFGMCQVTPNTRNTHENAAGYNYSDDCIDGFAFTQLSGTGCADLGNLLVSPTTGALRTTAGAEGIEGYRSYYDKASEIAEPGYYSAFLSDYGVKAEATATMHGGALRFTFPESRESRIQIDLARRCNGTAEYQKVKMLDDRTVEGEITVSEDCGGWCTGHVNYTLYFHARFSKPVRSHGVWTIDIPDSCGRKAFQFSAYDENGLVIRESDEFQRLAAEATVLRDADEFEGKHIGFFAEFDTKAGESVEFRSGISFVSLEGARINYKKELKGKRFDDIRSSASQSWNDALSCISVEGGGLTQKRVFYTCLYHALMDPRTFEDVDGLYTGGDGKSHKADNFTKRTIFSGWDVFRSEMPLLTLIRPDVVDDVLQSIVTLADESGKGYLERWELFNGYTGCMLGNPAVPVLADAWFKGIYKHDITKAYALADSTSRKFGNGTILQSGSYAGISHVLEYAYDEWCMARLAEALGKTEDAAFYDGMSKSYMRIYDPDFHSFRPVGPDGEFCPWPDKGILEFSYGCVESNPLQQQWFVPHDIDGLAELLGGRGQAVADLDTMFANTPADFHWNAYYNHSNEPVHHVPYLYNRLGQPWKTQKWTRAICSQAYGDGVEGFIGNEDVGQMSAWYVLSAAGLHPVCPGDKRFEITSPLFPKVTFNLPGGKLFTILAKDNTDENIYIRSARLNGKDYDKCHLDYDDIVAGGVLELMMGPEPNKDWGIQ